VLSLARFDATSWVTSAPSRHPGAPQQLSDVMTIEKLEIALRKLLGECSDDIEESDEPDDPPRDERPKYPRPYRDGDGTPQPSIPGVLIGGGALGTALISLFSWYMLHRQPERQPPISPPSDSIGAISVRRPSRPPDSVTVSWEAGSTAQCHDGWFSHSHHRSGTCSGHRGVAVWRYPATDTIWE